MRYPGLFGYGATFLGQILVRASMSYLITSQIDCFVVIYQRSPASSPEVVPEVPPGNSMMMVGGKQAQAARRQLNLLFPLWSNLPPFYWRSLITFERVLVAARMRSAWWPWSHLLTNWMGCKAWWALCSFAICVRSIWTTAVVHCLSVRFIISHVFSWSCVINTWPVNVTVSLSPLDWDCFTFSCWSRLWVYS